MLAAAGPSSPRTALSKKHKSQSLESESRNLEVEIVSRNSKRQRIKPKKISLRTQRLCGEMPLKEVFKLLAAVTEFIARQVEQQCGLALIAVGHFESVFKIGFFDIFDDGGKIDS